MKKLFASSTRGVRAALLAGSLLLVVPAAALAQQKVKMSPPDPGAVTKYTQQHAFDVGDVAGHQIRIASLQTKFSDQAGNYDGVKFVESSGWLTSDYINGSGRFATYTVLLMANGDKVYSRGEGLSQTTVGADGARKTTFSTVTTITGGTGRFATLRGSSRGSGTTDFKTGATTSTAEGEYWFDK